MAQIFKVGETVRGFVKSLVPFGAFISLGEVDALLPISEICHSRIEHPIERLSEGDKIKVKIISSKKKKGKLLISVSLKALAPNPWEAMLADGIVKQGNCISATIQNVVDYGAFAEVAPGVCGLIHISEIPWGGDVKNRLRGSACNLFQRGDRVVVLVKCVDNEQERISLSFNYCADWPENKEITNRVNL